MAGYGYRSSTGYSSPQTDDWGKTSHASDHVCRPVIVDAEGRKRPIVSFTPNQNSEYYVTRTTETVVQEQILSPYASEMNWSPESHVVVEEKWQKHPSPVHDCPPKVDEFVTKVQTEASRPKFGPMSASTWRQTAKPSGYGSEFNDYSHNNNNDWKKPTSNGYGNDVYDDNNYNKYGNNNNNNSSGWNKPSTTNINTTSTFYKEPSSPVAAHAPRYRHADPVLVDTYDNRETIPTGASMITHGGWARPSSTTWSSQPHSNISKPTSDIPTAIGILKEVAKPFISPAQNSWYAEPGYIETVDSKEAAARYGNFGKFKSSPKPYTTENNYVTIDSREAARKYHGAAV